MSSSEVKEEEKSKDKTCNNELQSDDTSIKDKSIESVKDTETNGEIEHKSANTDNESEIHVDEVDNEIDTASIEQKSTQFLAKQSVTQTDEKREEPKSAVDEVKKSPQGNLLEKKETERVVDVNTQKAVDGDSGKKKETDCETTEKEQPLDPNSTESDQTNEKDKNSTSQVGLPKWMVQDANAPSSPSPEVDGNKDQQQQSSSPQKMRGRGRGRRPAAEKASALKDKTIQTPMEDNASQRPRRSTRTRIDYANPDAVTVLAEVDDEEPSGAAKRQKGARGLKLGQDKGLKRKTTGTSEDEVREGDDDDDLDYGAKKKKKRVGTGSPGKRGRPVGSKSKTMTKAKNMGHPKRGRTNEKESDDDDAEVIYDDRVSEKERTTDDEFEEAKPSPNKAKTSIQSKPPTKKRGRPPGRRQGQQTSVDNGKTAKSEMDEAKIDEESGTNQQTINVEA